MNIENILVPFDFSRYSDAALQMASYIARDHGATLHVVHVKEPVLVHHVEGNYIVHPYGDLDGLKMTLETVTPADPTVEIRHWLMTGDVVGDLLSLADQQKVLSEDGMFPQTRTVLKILKEDIQKIHDLPEFDVVLFGNYLAAYRQRRQDVAALVQAGFSVGWAGDGGSIL